MDVGDWLRGLNETQEAFRQQTATADVSEDGLSRAFIVAAFPAPDLADDAHASRASP
jgi:hypothetical protein